jgi:hypothetical protein
VWDTAGRERLYARQLRLTVAALRDAGKNVILVYPVPETGYAIPVKLSLLQKAGSRPEDFTRPAAFYRQRNQWIIGVLDSLEVAARVYPDRRLCDRVRCIVYANGAPLYFDDDHLSLAGAAYIAPLFEGAFEGAYH